MPNSTSNQAQRGPTPTEFNAFLSELEKQRKYGGAVDPAPSGLLQLVGGMAAAKAPLPLIFRLLGLGATFPGKENTDTLLSVPWYHGTTKAFSDFSLPKKFSPQLQVGVRGLHFARDPEFAGLYAQGQGGNIQKVTLNPKKTLDTTKLYDVGGPEENFAKDLLRGTGRRLYTDAGKFAIPYDAVHPKKLENTLRKHGYDAVKYEAKFYDKGVRHIGNKSRTLSKSEAMAILSGESVSPWFGVKK